LRLRKTLAYDTLMPWGMRAMDFSQRSKSLERYREKMVKKRPFSQKWRKGWE
jgi:hypothetical protein